uniref:Uncharacterized protein n=1 Tax=Octopus bimaculoides TaxID=37653 RepID=A0A0L8H4G6_OCTBM
MNRIPVHCRINLRSHCQYFQLSRKEQHEMNCLTQNALPGLKIEPKSNDHEPST